MNKEIENIKEQLEEVINRCILGGYSSLTELSSLIADEVLKVVVEKIRKEVENKVHIDIHKSLSLGMDLEEKVIHYYSIIEILSNLSLNKDNEK